MVAKLYKEQAPAVHAGNPTAGFRNLIDWLTGADRGELLSGTTTGPYFTPLALWRVYNYSKGIPRLVNAVCDKCLLAGYVKKSGRIGYNLVGTAIKELEGNITV